MLRAAALLRRSGPVPGILAARRPGAPMDKSARRLDGKPSGHIQDAEEDLE